MIGKPLIFGPNVAPWRLTNGRFPRLARFVALTIFYSGSRVIILADDFGFYARI